MQFHEPFPPHRRLDRRPRAEARVYDAIAASSRPGYAFYEFQHGPDHPELDFVVWMEGVGRFAIQVKGGQYRYERGRWHLRRPNGTWQIKPCPLSQTWDAALALVQSERDATEIQTFVLAVLIFTDAAPDERTRRRVERSKIHAVWGGTDLPTKRPPRPNPV